MNNNKQNSKKSLTKLLLTNDDGIYAPGLFALYSELKNDFDISIVAPESEMSAVGHAITLYSPLRVKEINRNGDFFGYAVNGTPADCVKIALQELLDQRPDIILSGINLGANVGIDVLYSGTVSAATEGAFLGVKSAAISLATRKNPDFSFAAQFSRQIIKFLKHNGFKTGTALNVNIPAIPKEKLAGIRLVKQGTSRLKERFERRTDPRGNVYYWLVGEIEIEKYTEDTDLIALKRNKITITPITCDLTSFEDIENLKPSLSTLKISEDPENQVL